MRPLIRCLLVLTVSCGLQIAAADSAIWKGAQLTEFLEFLNGQGLHVIYSSDLVSDDYLVVDEPNLADLRGSLTAALMPFGLSVNDGPAGSLLVVRVDAPRRSRPTKVATFDDAPLPEIVITTSLYRLENTLSGSHTYLDRELATRIPAAAEEAVRLTNRVPGTASGGISTRNHVRGGEANEVLFLLDGLRLYEPYHLKDFQSVATIVNSHAITGIDFYTGAYPARYGDRMSGVMSIGLREPVKQVETELSLSFFNASALSLGIFGDEQQGDWLVAARRGNLDLIIDVIDPDFGSPDYSDLLMHMGWEFGPLADIKINYLASNDKIRLTDADRGEQARANYENEVFWLKWISTWSGALRSETILSYTGLRNDRNGSLNLPGIVIGALDDASDYHVAAFKQDWIFAPPGQWMLSFGVDAKHVDAKYQFSSTKAVSPPFDGILDNQPLVVRDFDTSADGAQYAAYAELKWRPRSKITIGVGLRRDHQSYTTAQNDAQTSPRASLLYRISDRTEFRLGWGQFSQAQEANELQISDGIDTFFPAQRAEHVVANLKHSFAAGVELDLSLYRKSFRKVRPRFENAFDSLTLVPEIQFDRVRIDSDSAESRGAEFMLSKGSSAETFFWWVGYAWSVVEDSTAAGKLRRSWDQTQTGKAGMSWRWKKWDFSAAAEAHTGWPKTELIWATVTNPDGSEELIVSTTELNARRHSNFHTLDARVSRVFDVKRGDLTLFLEVTNLYDRANPCCTEYSLDASNSGASTIRAKEANWLPLLPSLGVIWRF